jgi:hypothetical protein
MDNIRINSGQYLNNAAPKKAEDTKDAEPRVESATDLMPLDERIMMEVQAPSAEKKVQEEKKAPPSAPAGDVPPGGAPKASGAPTKIFAEDSPARAGAILLEHPAPSLEDLGATDSPVLAVLPYDPESGVWMEPLASSEATSGDWIIATRAPAFFQTGLNSIDSIAKEGLFTINGEKIA